MKSPENSGNSRFGKKTVAAIAIAGAAGAWFGAEPVARHLIQEPGPAPTAPQKPEPQPVKRDAVEIAVGFDTTRSQIMKELPTVVQETGNFFENTHLLMPDDKVTICTFAEDAKCESFTIPAQKTAMLQRIRAIKPEEPRNKMQTYVHRSIESIAGKVHNNNSLVLAWTDASEEERTQMAQLPAVHPPITIVVPNESYLSNAEDVKRGLGNRNVSVAYAGNGQQFGSLLNTFTGKLEAKATQKAKADADALFQKRQAEYNAKMMGFQDEQDAYAAKKVAVETKIENVKTGVKITAGSLLALAAAALSMVRYRINRPKIHGWIMDTRGPYAEIFRLPPHLGAVSLDRISPVFPPGITLNPARDGLYAGGKKLASGQQLAEGIFWFENEPDESLIQDN